MVGQSRAQYPFYSIEELSQSWTETDRGWLPSKPVPGPWLGDVYRRVRAAWAVLAGRAAAVEWR